MTEKKEPMIKDCLYRGSGKSVTSESKDLNMNCGKEGEK